MNIKDIWEGEWHRQVKSITALPLSSKAVATNRSIRFPTFPKETPLEL